jgi:hypothetical protein
MLKEFLSQPWTSHHEMCSKISLYLLDTRCILSPDTCCAQRIEYNHKITRLPLNDMYRMTHVTFRVSASSFAANMAVGQNVLDFSLKNPLELLKIRFTWMMG